MEHWFIYYKLPPEAVAPTLAAVRDMQARLAADCGVAGQVLRKQQADGDVATLMEIYAPIAEPDRFARAMDAALAASALTSDLRTARRLERFVDA
jgi:hypothetical protein